MAREAPESSSPGRPHAGAWSHIGSEVTRSQCGRGRDFVAKARKRLRFAWCQAGQRERSMQKCKSSSTASNQPTPGPHQVINKD